MNEIQSYKLIAFITIVLFGITIVLLIGFSIPWSLTYLGRGYIYDNDYKYISGYNKVPPQIECYYNSWLFITIKQNPIKFKREYPENFSNYKDNKYKDDTDKIYYWIIDKCNKHLYGPYSYGEYQCKCDSLGVRPSQMVK